jgi:hypothetical protein
MKKLLLVLAIGAFAACNNNATEETKATDTVTAPVDTLTTPVDTAAKPATDTAVVDTLKK